MPEAGPGVGLDGLQGSAPPRDFVRCGAAPATMAVCPVPLSSNSEHDDNALTAIVLALLARHARRHGLAVVLRHRGAAAGRTLQLQLGPETLLSALASSVGQALDWAEAVPLAIDTYLPGVAIDFCADEGTALAADLVFCVGGKAAAPRYSLAYNAALYRHQSIEPIARQWAHLLATSQAQADVPVADLRLYDDAERQRILERFNALRAPWPQDATLAELIVAQAARAPGAVCAVHGEASLSFAALDAASTQLAQLLVALGVGPGRFVALVEDRGLDFVIAMVAIWKAGGAYIPLDPSYPAERLAYMLADSQAAAAIVGARALATLADALVASAHLRDVVALQPGLPVPAHDAPWRFHDAAAWQSLPVGELDSRASASDPAYMVYTSGSTGRPKGAIVRHNGAINHLYAQAHALGATAIARFLQSAPSSSDISVWQFAAPLVFGGTSVVVRDATDVALLLEQVQRHGLHLIELVPVVMKYFVEYAKALPPAQRGLPSLRWAMVTGESASVELVNAWLSVYPHIPLVNAYGPTEAADDVAQAVFRTPLPPQQCTVPIGPPLANVRLYVLDEALRPLPVGAPGEICVGGVGVGSGYWGQPEKTRLAFVPDPFTSDEGARLYRTGDLGRWRDDGALECLGRLDHQVQLRGVRIELQEIEAVLRGHALVSDAVAQVFHDGQGDGQLVAYIVSPADVAMDAPALRTYLAARLPSAMLPAAFVAMPELPLNPAGKVDRPALVAPQTAHTKRLEQAAYAAPRTTIEATLCQLWQQELSLAKVGIFDDFFALGGDSLAALAIVVGARAAGLRLRSADVLAHATVARLALVARPAPAATDATAPATQTSHTLRAVRALARTEREAFLEREPAYEDVRPLSPAQQGIYMHGLLSRDKTAYIDQYCYVLRGALDLAAFTAGWQHAVRRHAALRTAILRSALSQPVQAVRRVAPVDVDFIDHTALDPVAQAASWQTLITSEVNAGLDLATAPLMRLLLVRTAAGVHRLAWTHHHIVLDGWSLSLLLDEVLNAHASTSAGMPLDTSAAPPLAYYADWIEQTPIAAAEGFWRQALAGHAGAPPWTLAEPATPGRSFVQHDIDLGEHTAQRLAETAAGHGVTLATLVQAAWALLLARFTGGSDIVFGVATSGREVALAGVGRLVGLFVTTLPLRIATRHDGPALRAWLAQVQAHAAAVREHEAVPLAQIARWSDLAPGQALFESLLVMSNYPALGVAAPGGLSITTAEFRTVPAYPLSLIVAPGGVRHLRLVVDSQRFDAEALRLLAQHCAALFSQFAQGLDPRLTR